jgi:2-C-methyl-D-erythritol 2,4-cyclodiphosphate synthase
VSNLRIGQGFDAHKIIKGSKDFILGGISIDSKYEVVAHSDGDIISHAIIDALLGACKMGDIGKLAPSNQENKDISSIHLLKKVATMLLEAGYQIVNIDLTYVGEEPRLEKFKKKIEENLAKELKMNPSDISCKATTTDGLGYEGTREGISTQAIALVTKN